MADALRLEHVTKRFGSFTAVDDLSLAIPEASIYGFIGPNGAGKTTTIRMIMNIFLPDEGTIEVLGRPNGEEIKNSLGYLPEEKGLYKKMRTAEIVAYFGRLKGMGAREARTAARELLERYGLGEWADKPCEALSKGMGQKVQMLATIIHQPRLLILDEPFSGLDPVNRDLMQEIILNMKREGRTVIFSTHVMEQSEQICDYIFMINKGRKVLDGTLEEIKAGRGRGIMIAYDGDASFIPSLPGVRRVNDSGKTAEVFLEEGASPQDLLESLVPRLKISRFDVREPSLHEIFVRIVKEGEAA